MQQRVKHIIYMCIFVAFSLPLSAQINTERVMNIGRNALYFEDYVLSVQYFNQVINVKPYLAEPYFYRAIAKLSLEDYKGAEEDCNSAIERNPFIVDAYQVRGIARQNRGNHRGAIEDYTEGLKLSPEDKTQLLNKAIAEMEIKEYDKAEESYNQLIDKHPSFYNSYLSRSQLYLEIGDTTRALQDIDKSITLDKHLPNAYAQRAYVTMQYNKQYDKALEDIEHAIKLSPQSTTFYVARAIIKYYLNDFRGTMADYGRVLELDPNNMIAYYNRGLLRTQVGDRNNAISDFSRVIKADPTNYFAIYNRALLHDDIGSYSEAIADFDKVLEEYPSFAAGYYARSEAKRKLNRRADAEKDYNYAIKLMEGSEKQEKESIVVATTDKTRKESDKNIDKFNRLLVADDTSKESKYDSEYRGRVQDKHVDVRIEPSFVLSVYERDNELSPSHYYVKEMDDFNRAQLIPNRLLATNAEAPLSENGISHHFASIDDYSRAIDIMPNNPIIYFARALDFMLVQDFASAIDDLNRVIYMNDRFIFAYFNRAVVRFKQIETQQQANREAENEATTYIESKKNSLLAGTRSPLAAAYEMVLRDYDKVIQIAPNFFYAYYNRANVHFAQRNYHAAIDDYNRAIKIRSDFAQAYYNRGLIHLSQGDEEKGISDLSQAGELGIVSAYNMIKRYTDAE